MMRRLQLGSLLPFLRAYSRSSYAAVQTVWQVCMLQHSKPGCNLSSER